MADVKEEQINQLIEKYSNELSEDQIRVLPLISFGMSATRASKISKVSATTIRQWMRTDTRFRTALHDFQSYTNLYHMAMLNQAGALAWDRVFEILEADYDTDDKIGRTNQAAIARFIIAELDVMGNKPEEVKEPEVQLHVTESSADLIARRVTELQKEESKIVDGSYRIIDTVDNDPRQEGNSIKAAEKIDEEWAETEQIENEPVYPKHPATQFGELTYNEDKSKVACHICGKMTADLVIHIRNQHKINPSSYRRMYKIPDEIKFGLAKPVLASNQDIEEYNESLEKDNELRQ